MEIDIQQLLQRIEQLEQRVLDLETLNPIDLGESKTLEQVKGILRWIDVKTVRAVREGDTARIAQYEQMATQYRAKHKALEQV